LQFAVYGVFATCPDCTGMNASAVFHKPMEAARRRLSLLDGDLDSEMVEGLLSDALGSAVGAFDAVGKELCRRFPGPLPSTPRNLLQNIEALSAALGKATGSSLAEAMSEEQYASLARMFQVRHVYEHNLGVVDADAIKKVPALAAWRGRKYVLARSEIEAFLHSLNEAYDAVVRLLEAALSRRASQRSTAPRQRPRSLLISALLGGEISCDLGWRARFPGVISLLRGRSRRRWDQGVTQSPSGVQVSPSRSIRRRFSPAAFRAICSATRSRPR